MKRIIGAYAVVLGVGAVAVGTMIPSQSCRARDGLPDPVCTPGATNPEVAAENVHQTICVPGWTATIRPGVAYTNGLKAKGMRDYGLTGKASDFEEDHLIPLELGGNPTDQKNLWPQGWTGPNNAHDKDLVENDLHRKVCAGLLPLAVAQERIRTDWRKP